MRTALLLSLCAGAAGLSVSTKTKYQTNVHAVLLQDIPEVDESEMVPVQLKDFPVTVMTYANAEKVDKYVSKHLQDTKTWETDAIENLLNSYKEHGSKGNFLDVGGNIGSYALPMANFLKTETADSVLITVEASPRNQLNLKAGIKKNNLDNVHLFPYAVGDESGPDTLTFKQSSWNQGKSQVDMSKNAEASEFDIVVPATTLDSIMDQDPAMKKVFAMKMDIEGFEFYAMKGGGRLFTENPPCVVFVELVHTLPHRNLAREFLFKHGYQKIWNDDQNGWFEQTDMANCVARL